MIFQSEADDKQQIRREDIQKKGRHTDNIRTGFGGKREKI